MAKYWSERRDSNPRPLPPQSRGKGKNKQYQRRTSAKVSGTFCIRCCQSVASLWRIYREAPQALSLTLFGLPITLGEIGYGIAAAALLSLLAIYWNSRRQK